MAYKNNKLNETAERRSERDDFFMVEMNGFFRQVTVLYGDKYYLAMLLAMIRYS